MKLRGSSPASWMFAIGLCAFANAQDISIIDGITFAVDSDVVYVPVKDLGYALGWTMRSEKKQFFINERAVTIPKILPDGTRLIPLTSLPHLGLMVTPADSDWSLSDGSKELKVRQGQKRVVINKKLQKLRGFQGDRMVIETRVSTGRRGFTTPNGTWKAGPEKSRMRYSRKYDNSPMPWSIQINGGYFMHGYTSVPKRPASHGCVRLPLWGINYAKWLWHWVDLGTPITIANDWADTEIIAKTTPAKGKGPETIPVDTKRNKSN